MGVSIAQKSRWAATGFSFGADLSMEQAMNGLLTWLYLRARAAREERGASLVEYTLLVTFIAIACVGALRFAGFATLIRLIRIIPSLWG